MIMNYLNVFTESKAAHLVAEGLDYWEAANDMLMVVAGDNTVWVCRPHDTSASLNDCTLIQRIL